MAIKTTPEMRARLRELSSPANNADDYDRAVLALLDDFDSGVLTTGIHLNIFGGKATVAVEIGKEWITVITEHYDGEGHVSHIVEPAGVQTALDKHRAEVKRPITPA